MNVPLIANVLAGCSSASLRYKSFRSARRSGSANPCFPTRRSGYDLLTSLSAALTSLGNLGPGLGEVGFFDNFAHFSGALKLTLCIAMIAGRPELFTMLIRFHHDFWRR